MALTSCASYCIDDVDLNSRFPPGGRETQNTTQRNIERLISTPKSGPVETTGIRKANFACQSPFPSQPKTEKGASRLAETESSKTETQPVVLPTKNPCRLQQLLFYPLCVNQSNLDADRMDSTGRRCCFLRSSTATHPRPFRAIAGGRGGGASYSVACMDQRCSGGERAPVGQVHR